MSFPAGVATIQVTGQHVLDLGGNPLNGAFIFTPSVPVDYETSGTLLEGSATGEVVNGVMTPLTLPATDSVTPPFTYTITTRLATADAVSPPPLTGVSLPSALGPTVDISTLL